MRKFFRFGEGLQQGNIYEGIFIPLPGTQCGHLMVGGILIYERTDDGKQGAPVIFSCGEGDKVNIDNPDDFKGFFNLDVSTNADLLSSSSIDLQGHNEGALKPLKFNKREKIQAISKDAEEIVTAMKKYAVDGIVYLKDVKDVSPNKLYGHLTNLINAKIVERIGKKDKKRGTKIRILK